MIQEAHSYGVKVIASNHDFDATPEKDEIVRRLRMMQDYGADIPKMAVMPRNKQDVLTLLSATLEMSEQFADRPIITMSMAGTGVVSQPAGETFGSASLPSVQLPKLPHRDRSMSTSLHRFLTLSTKACDPVTSQKGSTVDFCNRTRIINQFLNPIDVTNFCNFNPIIANLLK